MNRIKIGCVPTRRSVFNIDEAKKYKKMILEKISGYQADIIDVNDINREGILYDMIDIEKIVNKLRNVDGVFFPHCNFGTEDLVAKVAKALNKPVLIWGPRDDGPLIDGERTRDTQCGLFATGKVLRRFNVPFTYVVNSKLDDEIFERGYNNFVSVCSVIRAFKKIRILQIAPRPAGFWTMICNEGELLEKYGIEIYPITIQEVTNDINRIIKLKDMDFIENRNRIIKMIDCRKLTDDELDKIIALRIMMKEYCEKEDCTAVAIQCWNALQDAIGIMPCISNGLLFDEGIPVACETDIHGAISSIILQEAGMRSSSVFFADFTIRHPNNDNAELLWHCGNFPVSLAKNQKNNKAGHHFIFPQHCAGTGEWELKGGDITLCRFDGDHGKYSLMMGEGEGVDGPKTKGTYVWFKVKDWPKWEDKLVTGPYVHHCAGIHLKVAPVLYEACKYIPELKADPIEPTEEKIKNYLRGY